MLSKSDKQKIIEGLTSDLNRANAIFLTNLIGIPSNDAVKIRKDVRMAQGKVIITRNTLFARAAKGTPYEALLAGLKGPSAVALSFGEAPAVAKVLHDVAKDSEIVKIKGGVFDGKSISVAEVEALAKLPSRDQMLGTLLATFNAPISAFARVIEQIRVQKESGGAPAAAAADETTTEA